MSTATVLVPAGTYTVDPSHSRVEFSVKHLGIANVKGSFGTFEGTLVVVDGDIGSAKAYGTVDVATLDTKDADRDAHLRSADFFDAEQLPKLSFEATAIVPVDDDTFEITGDLTLHGVTNRITLKAEVQGTETDPWGNERVGLEVTGQLNRSDYGMKFNQALGSGNMLVSDKVKLALDISAVKQP
ncbi:MAG: YceI family protein [Solirubrobacterales bacterium]|nr:YceI family protein [Solirubrobacterales bacterium]